MGAALRRTVLAFLPHLHSVATSPSRRQHQLSDAASGTSSGPALKRTPNPRYAGSIPTLNASGAMKGSANAKALRL